MMALLSHLIGAVLAPSAEPEVTVESAERRLSALSGELARIEARRARRTEARASLVDELRQSQSSSRRTSEDGEPDHRERELSAQLGDLDLAITGDAAAIDDIRREHDAAATQLQQAQKRRDEAAFVEKASAHVEHGTRIDELLATVAKEIEKFITNDIAVDRSAQHLDLHRQTPLDGRLAFGLSNHLFTEPLRHAIGSTSIELSVTYSRHRGGLTFAEIAKSPAIAQLAVKTEDNT